MKKLLMVVNNNIYETSQKIVDNILSLILDSCKEKKLNMIYALKKGNKIELTKLTYNSNKEMNSDYKKFKNRGFTVYKANFGVDESGCL